MTGPVTVRVATEADLPGVMAIERQCAKAPHWAEEEYRRIINGRSALRRCLLVVEGGFAVGKMTSDDGELESVVVSEAFRRRGLGEALCRGVIGWCREQGGRLIELEVRAASGGPRRLYEKLGFRLCGQRPNYYRNPPDDAVLMRLQIAGPAQHGTRMVACVEGKSTFLCDV